MDAATLLLIIALPFTGIVLLIVLLNRWGKKHDPMGGSAKNLWSTTGTQSRSHKHRD